MIKLLVVILFVIVLEQSYQLAPILVAVVIASVSMGLANLLCRNERRDEVGLRINHKMCVYLIQLLKEIFFSTVSVCKAIFFKRKSDLQPVITKIITKQKTDEVKVLFGNSITLTPGTITIDIDKDSVMLHAITDECIEGAKDLDLKIIKSQQ